MKLKDLEKDIAIMEDTLQKMATINKEVEDMENQVDGVRKDLVEELHTMDENAKNARKNRINK